MSKKILLLILVISICSFFGCVVFAESYMLPEKTIINVDRGTALENIKNMPGQRNKTVRETTSGKSYSSTSPDKSRYDFVVDSQNLPEEDYYIPNRNKPIKGQFSRGIDMDVVTEYGTSDRGIFGARDVCNIRNDSRL